MISETHSFGTWLRLKRKSLDLTREGLAERVACSAATIRKLETEERRPSAQIAGRLMEIFSIPASEEANFLRFARGNWKFAPAVRGEIVPWLGSPAPPRSNVPASLTSLIGRKDELNFVGGYLSDSSMRLVTLIGPPGIGKTRLAKESARASINNFPDGVFFIDLTPIDDPCLIAPTIVQSLGYVDNKNRSDLELLKEVIYDKRMLLVLDDCDHLINSISELSSKLLMHCPQLKILATSRESLRVPGEWQYHVPALNTPPKNISLRMDYAEHYPALTLFIERARSVQPDFVLTANNIQTVAAICNQLDGIPLAIELIASNIRFMSPQALLESITDQFVFSTDGTRPDLIHKKTLWNAIDWSYCYLPLEEQRMFTCLAVFAGSFGLNTVISIFKGMFSDQSIHDLVIPLSDKSMLKRSTDASGEVRLQMLNTIRQYAFDKLRSTGSEVEARNRHLSYFNELAGKCALEIHGPDQAEWIDLLENELDNLRVALDWGITSGQTETAINLLEALGWPWEVRGHYNEAWSWFEKIRSLPDVNTFPIAYTRLLNHIGRHSWIQERIQEADTILSESRAISEKLGKEGEPGLADTLNWMGLVILFSHNDHLAAQSMFSQSLEINQNRGDERGVALSKFHLGILASMSENDEAALSLLEKSLIFFRQSGDRFFIARNCLFLGHTYMRKKIHPKALFFFEEQLRFDTEIHHWDGIAEGWRNLGFFYRQTGQYEQASQCYDACLMVCDEHGLQKNDSPYIAGLIALYLNNYELAKRQFTQLLQQIRKTGDYSNLGILLIAMAAIASGSDQPERAAHLNGAGLALLEEKGGNYPEQDLLELERHIQKARIQLGITEFNNLAANGGAMLQQQALAYALLIGYDINQKPAS